MSSFPTAAQKLSNDDEDEEDLENEDEEYDREEDSVDREALFEPVVQTLVAALGGYEEIANPDGTTCTIYRPGDSIHPVLRSLKRLWRKDDTDDERTVFRLFSRSTLFPELLALVKECTERGDWGRKIALGCADLMTGLTWPIEVEKELRELRDEGGGGKGEGQEGISDYASLLRAQWEYKAMILRDGGQTIRSFMLLLLPSLGKKNRDRSERDKKIISLLLHLVRNLLAIRDGAGGGGDGGVEGGLQSELIKQLSTSNFYSLFNTLANNGPSTDYNEYNTIVLDILFLSYKGIDPVELVKDRQTARKEGLRGLLEEEERGRREKERKGMSRHGRFGTTIAVRSGATSYVLHKQTAISESAAVVMDGLKRKRAQKGKQADELNLASMLNSEAMGILHDFAESFLHSFDPFFSSVLKDIRMMRSKVRETDNLRCLFLSRFFMEYFLLLRGKEQKAIKEKKLAEEKKAEALEEKQKRDKELSAWANLLEEDNPLGEGPSRRAGEEVGAEHAEDEELRMTFGLMAEMLEDNTRMWLNKRLRESFDVKPPAFIEIQACLDFSTQLLTLLEYMSVDKAEEWQEAAMTVSDKVFYHAEFVESAFDVLAGYRDQSMGYLNSAVEFVYTLLKTLEKYTKQRGQLVVRKRRAAGRKRNTAEGADDVDEEEEEGLVDNGPSFRETEIQFKAIEGKLLNERVTKSLMSYLSHWRELNANQEKLKRVVSLMHRMAVRRNAEELFFKVSGLILFRAILDDQRSLAKTQSSKDLLSFITYVLRKFFKSAQEQPLKLAEAFFPAQVTRSQLRGTASDSEDERISKRPKIPAELEFKPDKTLQWHEKLGIAMSCLLSDNQMSLITWLLENLRLDSASRHAIILDVDGEVDENSDDDAGLLARRGPSMRAKEQLPERLLLPENEDQTKAVTFNSHFKLLLSLVSYAHLEDEDQPVQLKWVMPKSILPADIDSSIRVIEQYLREPYEIDPGSTKELLRKKRKSAMRRLRRSGSEPDFDSDMADGPGARGRGNRGTRQRTVAEVQAFKSAQFIVDSDDDADADAAFFAKEAAKRALYRVDGTGTDHLAAEPVRGKRKSVAHQDHSATSGDDSASAVDAGSYGGDSEEDERMGTIHNRRPTQKAGTGLPDSPSSSSESPDEEKGIHGSASEPMSSHDSSRGGNSEVAAFATQTRRKKRVVAASDDDDEL